MEPMLNPSYLDQVIARANRFKEQGYKSGSVPELQIYMYKCSVSGFTNHMFQKMKKWNQTSQNSTGRIFWKRFTLFDQDTSPDFVAHKKMVDLQNDIKYLKYHLPMACKLSHTKSEYDAQKRGVVLVADNEAIQKCKICSLYTRRRS